MMRVLAALVSVSLLSVPMTASNEWSTVIVKLEQSVVTLTGKEGGWCTAWVIDEARDFVATMYHCKSDDMMVDGIPATLIKQEPKRDLMVLHAPNLDRPALLLAKDDPAVGDRLLSYGFGYGLETPMAREVTVGDVNTDVEASGWPGPLVSVDSTFEPGQSGGPCVNQSGEVAMMIKGGTDRRGVGPGAKIIRSRIGGFLAKPKSP